MRQPSQRSYQEPVIHRPQLYNTVVPAQIHGGQPARSTIDHSFHLNSSNNTSMYQSAKPQVHFHRPNSQSQGKLVIQGNPAPYPLKPTQLYQKSVEHYQLHLPLSSKPEHSKSYLSFKDYFDNDDRRRIPAGSATDRPSSNVTFQPQPTTARDTPQRISN
jgi:hypothetical protein